VIWQHIAVPRPVESIDENVAHALIRQTTSTFLGRYRLERDPGTQWEYSNVGVGPLGHALPLRAGISYEELFRNAGSSSRSG
jgi:CubicO group peptidase (beta-lactamase class C family)